MKIKNLIIAVLTLISAAAEARQHPIEGQGHASESGTGLSKTEK